MPENLQKILVLLSALVLVVSWSSLSLAEPEDETADFPCSTQMVDQGYRATQDYSELLNAFFLGNVDSSEQVETAMGFYRGLEKELDDIYLEYAFAEGPTTIEATNNDQLTCRFYRDQLVRYSGELLQSYVLGSSNSKRTFRIRDGLDTITKGLDDFSGAYFETFPAMFKRLDDALPCYASQCL